MQALSNFWAEQDGQDLIEYSLLIAFLAIFTITMLGTGQPFINAIWHKNTENLRTADSLIGH
jgi:Flp pilus assembly pilin Flp